MSTGPSFLTIHERPNGDIGLRLPLPNQSEDMYVLRGSTKPGAKGSRCTQDVVRCKDDTVLASVAWVNPKKDMIKIEKAAYAGEKEGYDSWMRLEDAWKGAAPTKGDCIEEFTGSDHRSYEWRLEMRNLRKVILGDHAMTANKRLTCLSFLWQWKLYAPDRIEHIAVEIQFTPRGHTIEMNPVDCVGVGEMLYVTLLVSLARRRHKRKHGLPGIVSRAVENVLFM